MIFVTVGTHEQPFNRLIKKIDELKKDNLIKDDVFIQTGFSTYIPKYCKYSDFLPYQEMIKYVKTADIVITHGGPSSFIMPLQFGKIPVVVPRQEKFKEHVNNHQLEFAESVNERYHNLIIVEDIDKLYETIINYRKKTQCMNSSLENNNSRFCEQFEKIAEELVNK